MEKTGAKTFYMPSADYIWPHVLNAKVREVVEANGGTIVGEEYFPMDQLDYSECVERIMASGAEVVFNTIVPPGVVPFFQQLHDAGLSRRGGQLVCTYFDENLLAIVHPEHVEALYSYLDSAQEHAEPLSKVLLARYDELFPGRAQYAGGSARSG